MVGNQFNVRIEYGFAKPSFQFCLRVLDHSILICLAVQLAITLISISSKTSLVVHERLVQINPKLLKNHTFI